MEYEYVDIELALYEKDFEKLYDLEENRISEIRRQFSDQTDALLRLDDYLIEVRIAQRVLYRTLNKWE